MPAMERGEYRMERHMASLCRSLPFAPVTPCFRAKVPGWMNIFLGVCERPITCVVHIIMAEYVGCGGKRFRFLKGRLEVHRWRPGPRPWGWAGWGEIADSQTPPGPVAAVGRLSWTSLSQRFSVPASLTRSSTISLAER